MMGDDAVQLLEEERMLYVSQYNLWWILVLTSAMVVAFFQATLRKVMTWYAYLGSQNACAEQFVAVCG